MASGTDSIEDMQAVQGFLEWAESKKLDVESVSCGSVSVSLREHTFTPVVIEGKDVDPEREDEDEDEILGDPPDVYAAIGRQIGVRR